MAFHDEFVEVAGLLGAERVQGQVVELPRCRGNSTYPEHRVIPTVVGRAAKSPAEDRLRGSGLGIIRLGSVLILFLRSRALRGRRSHGRGFVDARPGAFGAVRGRVPS